MKATLWVPLLAILSIGCLSGCSNGYTFAYKPKVGDSATYAMKVTGSAAGQPLNLDGTMTMKVSDAGSGNFNIETVESGMMGSHTTVETVDANGKVLKATLDGKPTPSDSGSSTRDMMPNHPVKIGETWTGTRSMQGKSATAEYKLEKVDTVGGVQLATVDITKLETPGLKLTEPAKIVLEPATGTLHSMNISIEQTVQGQTVTSKISMEKK